jgi:hypothetical protein
MLNETILRITYHFCDTIENMICKRKKKNLNLCFAPGLKNICTGLLAIRTIATEARIDTERETE